VTPNRRVQGLAVWLLTSLLVSLIPFLILSLAYRAFYVQPHGHQHVFPPWSLVLGRGDLFPIVFALAGAAIGELLTFERPGLRRHSLVGVSLLLGLAAMSLFTVLSYATLTHQDMPVDRTFVMQLGLVLLSVGAIVQALVILSRPS
jgi:hypothetical protein